MGTIQEWAEEVGILEKEGEMKTFTEQQEQMIREAIEVNNRNVSFSKKLEEVYGMSVMPSSDILIQQIGIILEKSR